MENKNCSKKFTFEKIDIVVLQRDWKGWKENQEAKKAEKKEIMIKACLVKRARPIVVMKTTSHRR